MLTPFGAGKGTLWLTEENSYQETVGLVGHTSGTGDVRRIPLDLRLPTTTAALHDGTVYLLATGGALVAVDVARPASSGGGSRPRSARGRCRPPTTGPCTSPPLTAGFSPPMSVAASSWARPVPASRRRDLGCVADLPARGHGRPVFGSAPDGSVFAVDESKPGGW